MLENEPEGGERFGSQPAAESAGNADNTAVPDNTAVRHPRTTRRRSTSRASTAPDEVGGPVEASADSKTVSGEAPDGEVLAPVTGDTEPTSKAPRRRRKATTAEKRNESGTAPSTGQSAESAPDGESAPAAGPAGESAGGPAGESAPAGGGSAPAGGSEPAGRAEPGTPAAESAAEPAAPVKTTRTRRRKAAAESAARETSAAPAGPGEPPAGGPTTAAEGAAGAGPAGAAGPAEGAAGGVAPAAVPADVPQDDTPEAEPAPRTRRRRAALSAPTVLFMAPEPEAAPVRQKAAQPAPEAAAEPTETEPEEPTRRRRRGRRTTEVEVDVEPVATPDEETGADEDDEDEDEETAAGRRRRRRGRRGRGRGKGTTEDAEDEDAEEAAEAIEAAGDEDEETEGADGVTRRRRRRRRKGAGDTDGGIVAEDDGVPTVVKIREPRRTADEVQGVSGSTRLEAKRQRRRDGREQRRTRPPILSESEFLARREAVDRVMVVRQRGDRTQIGVLEDGVLVEHYVTRNSSGTMAGNVYLGKVQNVLPSMEAAFVDIGRGRNAVLYAGEVNWDATGLEGRARSIEQALRSGDAVLVQVTKDPIGHKGARLTSHIALSGRHLVYVPNGNSSGISRKLPDTERKRLRDVLKKLVPDGAGVIVRTAAEGATEDELARDVKRLQAQWEDIQAKAAEGGAPVLLSEEPDLVIRVVRDLFNEDFRELIVEGDEAFGMVESYLGQVSPDLVARLRRHAGADDVFAEWRIDEQILKGLDRKVYLPSGGHLVIDRTEAMTVVDVNTGKYTGAGGNLEETVTRNNLEAAEEIVRQLRLRDLGGIVVIDFIDMVLESNRELVLRRLTECLGRDRTKHQVTEITSLGLVQMTRKRIGAGLLEAFSETCECCKGRGVIIHTEPVPEKPRSAGAGDKVKAVASASSTSPAAPVSPAPSGGGRRRGRRSASSEPATSVEVEVTDEYDTMGYDLSRYESDTSEAPAMSDARDAEPMRLTGSDDPDAAGAEYDDEGDGGEGTAGGRRRARRGGARRRTRP